MGFFGLFGLAGLYARQVEKSGWLGLVGFVMFSIWLALMMSFSFVEAFILPRLATESPAFVAGFLGMFTGTLDDIGASVYRRPPALRHCYLPRRRPAAHGGRVAGSWSRVDPRGRTSSAPARTFGDDSGGSGDGLAGVCALL